MSTLLCGSSIAYGANEDIFAELLSVSDFGFTRKAVDASSGDNAGGWATMLFSCIRSLKPVRIQVAFIPETNMFTALASSATINFTMPVQPGNTSGDEIEFTGTATDVSIGGQLEDRILLDVTITPTGAPTFTAGT